MDLRNRYAGVWQIVFAAGLLALAIILMAYHVERQSLERQHHFAREQVRESLSIFQARLEHLLTGNIQLARGLVAVVASNPDLSQSEFEKAAQPLFEGRSILRNIGLAPDMVIRYVFPVAGNEKAIGLDFRKDSLQRESAEHARHSGDLVLAGPLNLVQGGQGLIARFPVFINHTDGGRQFWGLISVVMDVHRLYEESGLASDRLPIAISIRGKDGKGDQGEVFYGSPDVFANESVRMTVTIPNGSWEIAARPLKGWGDDPSAVLPIRYGFAMALLATMAAMLFLARSIYRRNVAKEELFKKSHQLSEAQRIAKMGSWEWDFVKCRWTCSEEVFRILEIDRTKSEIGNAPLLAAIHPEDRQAVSQAYVESLKAHEPYNIVYRLKMPDGRTKQVRERCERIFDSGGQPLRSVGTLQDITELITAEERNRLYAKLFEHVGEAIVITDNKNRIIEVNAAFVTLTGYRLDEVRGMDPKILKAGNTSPETYQSMWSSLADAGYWQGELCDRRKDGSVYPKWVSISAIRDEKGNVTNYVGSFSDITERKTAEERMERLARYDALTGLFNRFSLNERLEQALASAHRDGRYLALMFIDMDRFKIINDTLGHQVGDALLVEVARRLQSCVRDSDIVARLGGDEFVVVLTGTDSTINGAAIVADKILDRLGQPYMLKGHKLHSTPSVGISLYPTDGMDGAGLMKAADTAMYHAKEKGRNNAQFFTEDMNREANERLDLERELRTAVEQFQFELHYQPQILSSGGICGMEALIRWHHPERGLIAPMKFIPLAEEIGLIEVIGQWVIEEACRQLATWKADGIDPGRVAVNLSARQLHSETLVSHVDRIMKRYRIQAGEFELEITESVAMADPEKAIGHLQALRELGIDLAIDDFGTGYSSLAYLKRLPIQTIKLDRSFVMDLEKDVNDAAISGATIALAHSLGLKVVAEGVEKEAQRAFLVERRCEILQGYLFSRPLPPVEAAEYIKNFS